MKKISTYLFSLIISIILVFSFIGAMAAFTAGYFLNDSKAVALAEKNDIYSKIYTRLDNYFSDKYNTTGIPKEVYLDAIDNDYLKTVTDFILKDGFISLDTSRITSSDIPKNQKLEDSISTFFNDYADKSGYKKDDAFDKKVKTTTDKAYSIIKENCDIYKFESMKNYGIIQKASRFYGLRKFLVWGAVGAVVILLLFILIANRKEISSFFYWSGISLLIAGAFQIVPAAYILSTKAFDSFSVKQLPIYVSYTSSMYGITNFIITAGIVQAAAGLIFVILCRITAKKDK